MRFRSLLLTLLALAVLAAPAFVRAGAALATAPAGHAAMADEGHCSDMPPPAGEDSDKGKALADCGVSMCLALAIAPTAAAQAPTAEPCAASFALPSFHAGSPGELPTPPPRSA